MNSKDLLAYNQSIKTVLSISELSTLAGQFCQMESALG